VVLTSDHGESLDEHLDYLGHGKLPFQPTVRVPLILRMPERLPEGRVVREPVGLVALYATILELLDVPLPEGLQEPSLVPWIEEAAETSPRPVFGNAGIELPAQQFVRKGRFKLVRFGHPEETDRFGELALYDLERDPGETRNVIGDHPEVATELRLELERWAAEDAGTPRPLAPAVEFEAEERDLLRALGYGR
jgi:arylsulfatase A-like enzyme